LDSDFLAVYRTVELSVDDLPPADLAILMSPSAARAYASAGGRAPAVTIGPQTTSAAQAAGVVVVAEARSQDVRGLVDSAAARRALALRDNAGRIHVGPDNGLLIPAAEKFGGIADVYQLANPEYALESVSRTFHGRDLFAPAAAHLALGVELAELGPPIAPDALARLDLPEPEIGASRIRCSVVAIDRFVNVHL